MQGILPTVDATDYFVISPNSGLITIAKSLATDTAVSGTGKRPTYKVYLLQAYIFLHEEKIASLVPQK